MRRGAAVCVACAALAAACAGPRRLGMVEWRWTNLRELENQRHWALACDAHPEPEIRVGHSEREECTTSLDCAERPHGWCHAFRLKGITSSYCHYDECRVDADCGPGRICHCGAYGENTCVVAGCGTNDDCGEGHWCSFAGETALAPAGYYCHTPKDDCVDDGFLGGCRAPDRCIFDSAKARWTCGLAAPP